MSNLSPEQYAEQAQNGQYAPDNSQTAFAQQVLSGAGLPVNPITTQVMLAWIASENTGAAYNPLALKLNSPGATLFNHDSSGGGVKNYSSFAEGVKNTISVLKQANMAGIRQAFTSAQTPQQIARAINNSPWVTGMANDPRMANNYVVGRINSGENLNGSKLLATGQGSGSADTGTGATGGNLDGFTKANAPALAAAMNDPTISKLVQQWDNGIIGDAEFQAGIEQSAWWRNTPQSERVNLVQQATDPSSAAQGLRAAGDNIQNEALKLGIVLDPRTLQSFSARAIAEGWTPIQQTQHLAAQFKYDPNGAYTGQASLDLAGMKQAYKDYALPMSNSTLADWGQRILGGTETLDSFRASLQNQAKSLYSTNPGILNALDSGQTVNQAMQPYASLIERETDVPANQVDWTSPKYNRFVQGTYDQTGKPVVPTLAQAGQILRTDPQYNWAQSQGAIQSISSGIAGLKATLGFGGN